MKPQTTTLTKTDLKQWMRHCARMIRQGKLPMSYHDLPEYAKTTTMKRYYRRIKKYTRLKQLLQ